MVTDERNTELMAMLDAEMTAAPRERFLQDALDALRLAHAAVEQQILHLAASLVGAYAHAQLPGADAVRGEAF